MRLVRSGPKVCLETVNCLKTLLAQAEMGEITAMSYAVMGSHREVFYSYTGDAQRNTAWATVMASTLMHGTMRRVFGETRR